MNWDHKGLAGGPWDDFQPMEFGKEDKYRGKEDVFQASCYKQVKSLPGDIIVYHIPNERHTKTITTKTGKKISPRGQRLKAQGVIAGMPDLKIDRSNGQYHGLAVELKVYGGRLSSEQRRQLWRFDRDGYMSAVVWSVDGMTELLRYYFRNEKTGYK